jgi:two-component system response regulator HydG
VEPASTKSSNGEREHPTVPMKAHATFVGRRGILEIVSGKEAGRRVEFEGRVRLGSRRLADVVVADERVSGLHCEFNIAHDLRVRDLGSRNGTKVGGVQVVEAVLAPGEAVLIGRTRVRVLPVEGLLVAPRGAPTDFFGLTGHSPSIYALIDKLESLVGSDCTVLIAGETGSGKERVAEALHLSSARANQPLVTVDCGSMPATLIESELFGFERGSFTGADRAFAGAFERANGGTLFLDEVGELSGGVQAKLLRVLQEGEIERLGGTQPIKVDIRVVAATNCDLAAAVRDGKFREDLFYRLNVIQVVLPPLRDRVEDIGLLADHFIARASARNGKAVRGLSRAAVQALEAYPWPGNVRELENALERAVVLSRGAELDVDDLPEAVRRASALRAAGAAGAVPPALALDGRTLSVALGTTMEEIELRVIRETLRQTKGDKNLAAQLLGIAARTIYRKLDREKE